MKIAAGLLVCAFVVAAQTNTKVDYQTQIKRAPAFPDDNSLYHTYAAVCAAAQAVGQNEILLSKVWTAATTQSIPCSVTAVTGGIIQPASGQTVTLAGAFDGNLTQHFDVSLGGTVGLSGPMLTVNPIWWGAVADGTGSGGSDQTAKIQQAIDAIHSAGGGGIFLPYAPLCYAVTNLKYYSGITFYADNQSTCVQQLHGNTPNQIFYNDFTEAVSDVHFVNFTIDGNRANITGISGDGGNYSIGMFGCSQCSIENMNLVNAYTDGINISCWGADVSHLTNTGDGVTILNTLVRNARRNNISQECGLNTRIVNSHLLSANGTNPEAGVDLEPSLSGQLNTGFSIVNSEIAGNNSHGVFVNYTGAADSAANFNLSNVYSHDNCVASRFTAACGEIYATSFSAVSGLTVSGIARSTVSGAAWSSLTTYAVGDIVSYNGSDWKCKVSNTNVIPTSSVGVDWTASVTAAVVVNGGFTDATVNVQASGAPIGVYIANVNTNILLSGQYDGSLYDLSIGASSVNPKVGGLQLVHGTQQSGGYALRSPTIAVPLNMAANGIVYAPTSFSNNVNTSSRLTVNDSATNPSVGVNDGTCYTSHVVVNTSGTFGLVQTSTACPMKIAANGKSASVWMGVDATGLQPTIFGLATYADNAAAVTAGLTAGMLYRITGADTVAVVH